jgi:hypothetical protein
MASIPLYDILKQSLLREAIPCICIPTERRRSCRVLALLLEGLKGRLPLKSLRLLVENPGDPNLFLKSGVRYQV